MMARAFFGGGLMVVWGAEKQMQVPTTAGRLSTLHPSEQKSLAEDPDSPSSAAADSGSLRMTGI